MDPISDMITTIKNGLLIHKSEISVPHSKLKEELLKILASEGFIEKFRKIKKGKREFLIITLKYSNNLPAISDIRRISKPGRRVYVNKKEITKLSKGFGKIILSTSKGIMTDEKARKIGIGGEAIMKIY